MDWQIVMVIVAIAVAAGYLVRQTWRTWSGKKAGCRGKCAPAEKAPGDATLISSDEISRRLRATSARR